MAKPTANPPNVALVVDDDLDLLEILKAALVEEADFRVLTAAVPDLVVPLVEAAPPAIVVLDIALPGQSGWEVLTALRQHPHFRTLPVLIVSAMPGAQARAARLQDPWVEFLAKPVDLEKLLKQVQVLVERHRQAAANAPPPDMP
jgi:DNA-binding response OmpR family regulator